LSFSLISLAIFALPGLGGFGGLPLLLLMFVAMYFLLIMPNQRKQKAWQTTLAALKTGDRITTTGGIRGTVVVMKDDAVIVRTLPDGVKLEIVKSAIGAITTEEEIKA